MPELNLNKRFEFAAIETPDYEFDLAGTYSFLYDGEYLNVKLECDNCSLLLNMINKIVSGSIIFEDYTLEFSDVKAVVENGMISYYFVCDFIVFTDGMRYILPDLLPYTAKSSDTFANLKLKA